LPREFPVYFLPRFDERMFYSLTLAPKHVGILSHRRFAVSGVHPWIDQADGGEEDGAAKEYVKCPAPPGSRILEKAGEEEEHERQEGHEPPNAVAASAKVVGVEKVVDNQERRAGGDYDCLAPQSSPLPEFHCEAGQGKKKQRVVNQEPSRAEKGSQTVFDEEYRRIHRHPG
jgi:hypothetical protein